MKVYASPQSIKTPEHDYSASYESMLAEDDRFCDDVRAWLKERGYKHALTGKRIALPWADGAAQYMIANGTTLIHLPIGDAWHVPTYQLRGLRVKDLKEMAF